MTWAEVVTYAEKFQTLIASLIALVAAAIAYRGATADARYKQQHDRELRDEEAYSGLTHMHEDAYFLEIQLGSSLDLFKSEIGNGKYDLPMGDELLEWVRGRRSLAQSWRYLIYLPPGVRSELRRIGWTMHRVRTTLESYQRPGATRNEGFARATLLVLGSAQAEISRLAATIEDVLDKEQDQ